MTLTPQNCQTHLQHIQNLGNSENEHLWESKSKFISKQRKKHKTVIIDI